MRTGSGDVVARLERLPLTAFHYKMLIVVGVMMLFDGYDLLISGLTLPSLLGLGWISKAGVGYFLSIPLFAAALGSVAAGFLGDRFGRRFLLVVNVIGCSLLSLLCATARNTVGLVAGLTLTMFFLGMQLVTGYIYLNEFVPTPFRGRFQAAVALLVNAGMPLGALLARLILPNTPVSVGWRLLFAISALPCVALIIGNRYIPESPRWLVLRGRVERADEIVITIEAEVLGKGQALRPPVSLPSSGGATAWSHLFGVRLRGRMFLALVFNVCHLVAIAVLASWLPTILVRTGLSSRNAFTFTAITFAGAIVGPALGLLIADRFERRSSIVVSGAVAVLCTSFYALGLPTIYLYLPFVSFALACSKFLISSIGTASYVPELFPTAVRIRGVGTSMFAGRLASASSPFLISSLLERGINPLFVLSGIGALYFALILTVLLLGPKTRGKTLEHLDGAAVELRQLAPDPPRLVHEGKRNLLIELSTQERGGQ